MNRWWNLALAGVLAWAWLGAPCASAQGTIGSNTPPQVGPPAFSPFLNLNRGGAGAGINYFGMVQPQQQTAQQIANLQFQQKLLGGAGAAGALGGNQPIALSTTGHPVRYFDYARYFPLGGMPGGSYGTANGIVPGGVPGAGYGQPGAGYGQPGAGYGQAGANVGLAPGFGMAPR